MKNLKEFKELIKTYRSITLEQIKEVARDEEMDGNYGYDFDGGHILHVITGFATHGSCTLCQAIKYHEDTLEEFEPSLCTGCVWSFCDDKIDKRLNFPYPCIRTSYDKMSNAEFPEDLLEAVNERADIMEEGLKSNGIKLDD